jgi:hypothetical protein
MRGGFLESIYALPASQDEKPTAKELELIAAYKGFWRGLRGALAGYEPDFLLVDTRTGFSPLSATTVDEFLTDDEGALSESLDLFVFAERGSEASRRGTQVFLSHLAQQPKGKAILHPRLTVVRRETPLMETVDVTNSPRQSLPEWLAGDDEASWISMVDDGSYERIRSDPEVEEKGKNLALPGSDLPRNILLDDYVRLTARLVGEEAAATRKKLGLPESETPMNFRLFRLPDDGGMHNIADAQPNISFTVNTFHDLVGALIKARSTSDQPLVELGGKAGRAYAEKLVKGSRGDRIVAIEEWLKIDSSVGWGQFELSPAKPYDFIAAVQRAAAGQPLEAELDDSPHVVVKHNDAFAPRDDMESNLCSFLGAYITGIVSQISGTTMQPSEHTVCRSKEPETSSPCEYRFHPKPQQ